MIKLIYRLSTKELNQLIHQDSIIAIKNILCHFTSYLNQVNGFYCHLLCISPTVSHNPTTNNRCDITLNTFLNFYFLRFKSHHMLTANVQVVLGFLPVVCSGKCNSNTLVLYEKYRNTDLSNLMKRSNADEA